MIYTQNANSSFRSILVIDSAAAASAAILPNAYESIRSASVRDSPNSINGARGVPGRLGANARAAKTAATAVVFNFSAATVATNTTTTTTAAAATANTTATITTAAALSEAYS